MTKPPTEKWIDGQLWRLANRKDTAWRLAAAVVPAGLAFFGAGIGVGLWLAS